MSDLNKDLLKEMINAAKESFGSDWNKIRPFAEEQFNTFYNNIEKISKLKREGKINEEQAKLQTNIQIRSMQTVLRNVEGLKVLAVESAINAALDVAKNTVNKAIGWQLL